MANNIDQVISDLTAAVSAQKTVSDSAETYIKGVPALIQAAIDAAQNAGATPAQLQAFSDLKASIEAETADLTAALSANTPNP
jgi:hypothetical protein